MLLNNNLIILITGKFLQVLVLIMALKLSTNLLSASEMGSVYLFIMVYSFFGLSMINPIEQYFNRNLNKYKQSNTLEKHLILYFIYLLCISILSYLFLFYLIKYGVDFNMSSNSAGIIISMYVFFVTGTNFINWLINMLHYRYIFTILTILTAFGIILFGYLFVNLFGNSAENWLLGTVVSNMIFMVIGFFVLKNRLNEKFHGFFYSLRKITKEKIKSILIFVLPLSVATLFMWLQNSGYRILIEQNISLEFLGFLGVGLAISSQIASAIESIIMQYFHPIYYKEITNATIEDRKKAIESLINKVLPIYFMLAIFLTFIAKYVVEILVDEKYYGVYIFTVFGIWIEFFRMSSNLFGNISQSEMNTKKFMVPYVMGSLLTIVLVYFSSLESEYEFYLPISLLIGGLFTLLVMYIFMKKLLDFKIDFRLIVVCFLISTPYISIYFFNFHSSLVLNLFIVGSFGLYFLGTIYFIYKKGLSYGNS